MSQENGTVPMVIGKKTFCLSQLSLRDTISIGIEIKRHVKSPLGRIVDDPAFAKMPLAVQTAVATEAARSQLHGDKPSEFDLVEYVALPEVMAFALWLMARKEHKDIRQDEISQEISGRGVSELQVLAGEIVGFFHQAKSETEGIGSAIVSPGATGTPAKEEHASTAS